MPKSSHAFLKFLANSILFLTHISYDVRWCFLAYLSHIIITCYSFLHILLLNKQFGLSFSKGNFEGSLCRIICFLIAFQTNMRRIVSYFLHSQQYLGYFQQFLSLFLLISNYQMKSEQMTILSGLHPYHINYLCCKYNWSIINSFAVNTSNSSMYTAPRCSLPGSMGASLARFIRPQDWL